MYKIVLYTINIKCLIFISDIILISINLHVLNLSHVIYVHIYLSIDQTEESAEKTEGVLQQMSKGKIVL